MKKAVLFSFLADIKVLKPSKSETAKKKAVGDVLQLLAKAVEHEFTSGDTETFSNFRDILILFEEALEGVSIDYRGFCLQDLADGPMKAAEARESLRRATTTHAEELHELDFAVPEKGAAIKSMLLVNGRMCTDKDGLVHYFRDPYDHSQSELGGYSPYTVPLLEVYHSNGAISVFRLSDADPVRYYDKGELALRRIFLKLTSTEQEELKKNMKPVGPTAPKLEWHHDV